MRQRWMMIAAAALLASACSDGSGGQPDAGDAGADAVDDTGTVAYPAPHPAMPQAVSLGGPVIASPKLVAVSFQNDTLQSAVDAFATQLQTVPAYWTGAVSEYGVGAITSTPFHAAETPPATLTDGAVQAWLADKIQNDPTFPQPDASTIYTLFYPDGTNVTDGFGTTCQEFQGYHDSFALNASVDVIYAIVPRCSPPVASVTKADEMTAEASHEIIEAATDPFPLKKPAYISVDANSHAWEALAGGEIGDLCAGFQGVFYTPTGFDHLVQRVWSNAAAAAGHDPCEPDGATPYFNSAAVVPDTITLTVAGQDVKTQGVQLGVGQSKTIDLDLYSDAPTSGPWKITLIDVSSAFFGEQPALQLSLDGDTGQNGDVRHLTIQSLRPRPGGALFWIQSDLGGASSVWLGAVNTN